MGSMTFGDKANNEGATVIHSHDNGEMIRVQLRGDTSKTSLLITPSEARMFAMELLRRANDIDGQTDILVEVGGPYGDGMVNVTAPRGLDYEVIDYFGSFDGEGDALRAEAIKERIQNAYK